ncbi:MAG TPA: CHRD domain-containing protein [Gaiellaceae bacterium]|nr:CHRD domain-containing protein [Gaiellaceae bacterium]
MRKFIAVLLASAVGALALTALSSAGTRGVMGVSAKLTAAQEVPKQVVKNTAATGFFSARLSGKKLTWKLTFSGLTGPATAAHIHMAAMGKAGNVVVVLCASTCKSGKTGTAMLTSGLLTALSKHLLYVNVHTAKNPNGEIRGQLAEH